MRRLIESGAVRGDRFLQIESWPVAVRMLEGASVHQSMIEIRPATLDTHTG